MKNEQLKSDLYHAQSNLEIAERKIQELEQQSKLKDRSDKITLLESYSKFLEKNGYMDADWWIDEFLKEENAKSLSNPKKCKHKNITMSDGLSECLDCGVRNY